MAIQRFYLWVVLACVLALAACNDGASVTTTTDAVTPGGNTDDDAPMIAQQAMDVTVDSPAMNNVTQATTTPIYATVFVPAHREGESYPLIIHSHGFGGSRVSEADARAAGQGQPESRDSTTKIFTRVDQQVRLLWDAGYAVISFDERGFGLNDDSEPQPSGGAARIIDPEFEVVDAIAVMNWAVANLDLTTDADGDARVGTIGGSYGGGYQLLLAELDDDPAMGAKAHVDAITPVATWYNLAQSLTPNRVIKKGFVFGLGAISKLDMSKLAPIVERGLAQAADNQASRFREEIDDDVIQLFFDHGLVALKNDPAPEPVDALLIQGQSDFLFNPREAINNYRFLNGVDGADVRLLTNQNGHLLPSPVSSNPPPLGPSACGPLDNLAAIRTWFDAKLRDNTAAISDIPEVCISLDADSAVQLQTIPRANGDFQVTIPDTAVTYAQNNNTAGSSSGLFIPMAQPIVGDGQVLAGIPVANLAVTSTVTGGAVDAVAFVGIGVKSPGEEPRLIDNQVSPLRSSDSFSDFELIEVGENLNAGDQVGVMLFGSFDQFENLARTNWASNAYSISGTVDLPIISAPVVSAGQGG